MHRLAFPNVLLATSILAGIAVPTVRLIAQDTTKGTALLAEARRSIGGEERVAAVRRLQVRGVVRRSAGATNIEGDLDIAIELPDRFRRDEVLSFGPGAPSFERTEVLNGAESWERTNGGNGRGMGFFLGGPAGGGGLEGGRVDVPPDAPRGQRQPPSPEDLERLRAIQLQNRRSDVGRLLVAFLLTTNAPVSWIGTAQSPDGTADVLEIAPAGGPVTRLLLDTRSHLPLMMSWVGGAPRGGGFGRRGGPNGGNPAGTGQDPAGPPQGTGAPVAEGAPAPSDGARGGRGVGGGFQPATFEMHFADYKTVAGIRLPHLLTRGINGQTNEEIEISSYRVNPTFKADMFSTPR